MELTLISLAALLLLLSGTSGPACGQSVTEHQPELMQPMVGALDPTHSAPAQTLPAGARSLANSRGRTTLPPNRTFPQKPGFRRLRSHCGKPEELWLSALRISPGKAQTRWPGLVVTGPISSSAPGRLRRRIYRTRFGFADGAYRALGPPPGCPSTKFGRYGI